MFSDFEAERFPVFRKKKREYYSVMGDVMFFYKFDSVVGSFVPAFGNEIEGSEDAGKS